MSVQQQAKLVVAGLIAYGSLYPFNFAAPPDLSAAFRNAFLGAQWFTSRGDVLGNIGLFVPWGLVWTWRRKEPGKAIWSAVFTALAFSFLLQLLQLWLPSRSAIAADVIWNMCGTFVGIAAARALSAAVGERHLTIAADDEPLLVLIGLWVLAELAPLVPSVDFEGIKGSLKPLILTPRFEPVSGLYECAQVLLVASLLEQRSGPKAGLRQLAVLLGGVIVCKTLIRGLSLDWSLVSGFCLATAAWYGMLSRDRNSVKLWVAIIAVVAYTLSALSPFEWRPPQAFAWLPFAGSLGGGMLANVRALCTTMFVLGGSAWLIRLLTPQPWRWASLLTGWVLILEIAQRWIVNRSAGLTEPFIVLGAMWVFDRRGVGPRVGVGTAAAEPPAAPVFGANRPLLVTGIAVLCIAAGLRIALSLPGIPYNVRGLFIHDGAFPILIVFALALLWLGAGPAWLSRALARSRQPYFTLPLALLGVSLVGYVLLSNAVTYESRADILGVSHRPGILGTLDHFSRYTALYSPLLVSLSLLLASTSTKSRPPAWWAATLAVAAAWLWLCKLLTIDWALTDNLTELIAARSPAGVSGIVWMYAAIFLLAAVTVATVRAPASSRARTLVALGWLAVIPVTWILLGWGLEPRVSKYGVTFSAIQFLLGPDRTDTLPQSALMLRWAVLAASLMGTLAVGAWVALSVADRRANLQSPLARAISAVTRIDRPLEPSALPVIDATPPRPAPAPQPGPRTVGERKPMLRRVRHPDRTAPASPKLIRRMPTDGSSDPRRRNSH